MRVCEVCGVEIGGRKRRYCGGVCRRKAWAIRQNPRIAPPEVSDDVMILAERRQLEGAIRQCVTCGCDSPIAVGDEDGEVRCYRCAKVVGQPAVKLGPRFTRAVLSDEWPPL